MKTPAFGALPSGKSLEKVKNSKNYIDGEFRNKEKTELLTDTKKTPIKRLLEFAFEKDPEGTVPKIALPSVKTDLKTLDPNEDLIVWFGHSSLFIQIAGKKILVDPVFSKYASPVPFSNKAFEGTNIYTVDDLPEIDILLITHDHYDHLDYDTVKKLKDMVGKVIVPLGVGEHFEYWGYSPEKIIELSWDEENHLEENVKIISVPSRHASGRLFPLNKTLWTSYILYVDGKKIFLGGDSSYGKHFKKIREKYGEVDIAILENGQYNKNWKYSHLFPEETLKVSMELGAKYLIPVHNSKFTLAPHAWYEPLRELVKINDKKYKIPVITPIIGEVIDLDNLNKVKTKHWFE